MDGEDGPVAEGDGGEQMSLYARVASGLRDLIEQDVLPPGLVLLEGPIASYFGVSRIPVRQALTILAQQGLIRTFHGRGYIVDPLRIVAEPLRIPFRSLNLPSRNGGVTSQPRRYEWQRIYDEVAGEITECLLFGTYQVREASLCDRYGISRTVVREVLSRLMTRGIIEKDGRSHWICGPFTARANRDQYEMRAILEVAALRQCMSETLLPDIEPMIGRIDDVLARPTAVLTMIGRLENDLHAMMFERCRNDRLKAGIVQNQLSLNVHHTFYRHFGVTTHEPMFLEHRRVLEALHLGQTDAALSALQSHLAAAWERSQARLKVLAVVEEPHLPDFLERTH